MDLSDKLGLKNKIELIPAYERRIQMKKSQFLINRGRLPESTRENCGNSVLSLRTVGIISHSRLYATCKSVSLRSRSANSR